MMESSTSSTIDISTLLFDLDGTLVDMKRAGVELRFMWMAARRFMGVIPPWRFRWAFWDAASRMQRHGTERTNYEAFVEALQKYSKADRQELDQRLTQFAREDFANLKDRFSPVPGARETLRRAMKLGFRLVLATNPVFPLEAVRHRMKWGLIDDIPFEFITHSEVMSRCKPDPQYYQELLDRLGLDPERTVMIGNDPRKDLPAQKVGIRTFLLARTEGETEHHARGASDWTGTFEDLRDLMEQWRQP